MSRIFSDDMRVGDTFPLPDRMVYQPGHSNPRDWQLVTNLPSALELRYLDMAARFEALTAYTALVVDVEDRSDGRYFTAVWSVRPGQDRRIIRRRRRN